ncbi:response regulator transcription factor [Desulfopila sp. IMCC35006]|uniref:response regulator transcription factor n=1 Tax=Desulfopila sp. IMCC35006 TaxID=2569542 RepID=UPI0010ABBA0B|nr:response regulator transcription factor [Desulfopila sp. IMCC35006]TKB24274.1 response regulator transcription factor [Desulfopila sp. IMCC35006]
MHILVVEDEPDLLEKLVSVLNSEQYTTETASDGEEALDKIWNETHDLILLDIMLPRLSGLEVLKEIRNAGMVTPVLMLSAKGDVVDKVLGLNLGADDYLPKPFSLAELLARVRALLRRGAETNPVIESGAISLNTVSREVLKDGEPVALTTKEFAILEFLLHNRGRAISRFVLAEHVWGDNFDSFSMSNFVDVHIKNLRKKLKTDDDRQLIKTVRGFGYIIDKG